MICMQFKALCATLCLALLAACGGSEEGSPMGAPTPSGPSAAWAVKAATVQTSNPHETTPVVWNGEVLHVYCKRDHESGISVATEAGDVLVDIPSSLTLCSAIVANGELMVFGRANNVLWMTKTSNLTTWSAPVVVWVPPADVELFNVSVAPGPTGYVMAYEFCSKGMVCFNFRFLRSDDLLTWTPVGGQYRAGSYSACPTIRYAGGWYYAFFLGWDGGQFSTHIARSRDLDAWELSPQTVVSPDGVDAPIGSGNTSDFDLVEFNGETRFVYLNFSQYGAGHPGTGLRRGGYAGTVGDFMAAFF